MESQENTLLLALAAHPGWMSEAFLQGVTGIATAPLGLLLEDLVKQGKVLRGEDERPYWSMADPSSSEIELQHLSGSARQDLHRRLFEFIQKQENIDALIFLLAYHAERAGLPEEAFVWNLRSGQALSAAGRFSEAQEHYRKAVEFAGAPDQASQALQQIGNLKCHLGLYREAEPFYREGLAKLALLNDASGWIRTAQSLAAALVEQGRYAEAHELLLSSLARLEPNPMSLEKGIITLHLTQVYIGMGMMREADASLREVKELFADGTHADLAAYEQLLEGKLETIQGRLAPAFRFFEDAARGFEARGDLAGKLEVLLSITAPLMEHYLIAQAQTLIDQISAWEDLKGFPALEHSVHLRRLALGAFSGKWVQGDLGLLAQEGAGVGRAEDWLQFWFHLSLAARRLKDMASTQSFLWRARAIVEGIASHLDLKQKESFLRRPDVARIWRLSAPKEAGPPQDQKVRAHRRLPDSGPAEGATLAPPTSPEKTEK